MTSRRHRGEVPPLLSDETVAAHVTNRGKKRDRGRLIPGGAIGVVRARPRTSDRLPRVQSAGPLEGLSKPKLTEVFRVPADLPRRCEQLRSISVWGIRR